VGDNWEETAEKRGQRQGIREVGECTMEESHNGSRMAGAMTQPLGTLKQFGSFVGWARLSVSPWFLSWKPS
jgi:hypothetical protein